MKKALFVISIAIVTILFFVSVGINVYLFQDKLKTVSIQSISDKPEVAGVSITPTEIPSVTIVEYPKCVSRFLNDRKGSLLDYDVNQDFTVIESVYINNNFLLENISVILYDNHNCEKLTNIKFNSVELAGTNSINDIKLKNNYLEVDYHINPDASILRRYYLNGDKKGGEEFFSYLCQTGRIDLCVERKLEFTKKVDSNVAMELVKKLPDVKRFMYKTKTGFNVFDDIDDAYYLVQFYESKDDYNVTYNWYHVNKYTGEIKTEFGN